MSEAPPATNLYLIGFMGVGKSLIGRWAARRLGLRFLDSDHVIEGAIGMPISDYFAQEGEAAFRAQERVFMENGHPRDGCVVACGGGLPMGEGMPDLLGQSGIVVCLFASAETIWERTRHSSKRPLLAVEDPQARIRELLAARLPIYQATGIGVSAEGRPTREIVENVVRIYRREAGRQSRSRTRKP